MNVVASMGTMMGIVKVKRRVLERHDLVAAEARYHVSCYRKFMKQQQPEKDNVTSPGRPLDSERMKTSNKICQWLEDDAELYALQEVQQNMAEMSSNDETYTAKWLKKVTREIW